jgi:hypothetical protein
MYIVQAAWSHNRIIRLVNALSPEAAAEVLQKLVWGRLAENHRPRPEGGEEASPTDELRDWRIVSVDVFNSL